MLMMKSICVSLLVGKGSGSDPSHAQSASYEGNMIKLNSVLSQTLGKKKISFSTNLIKMEFRIGEKNPLIILKIHIIITSIKHEDIGILSFIYM